MTRHKATNLLVIRAEHKKANEVVITYEDFSKKTMTASQYKTMHFEAKK